MKNNAKENVKTKEHKKVHDYLKNIGFWSNFSKIFNISNKSEETIEIMQQYLDTIVCDTYQEMLPDLNLTQNFMDLMNFAYSFR